MTTNIANEKNELPTCGLLPMVVKRHYQLLLLKPFFVGGQFNACNLTVKAEIEN